MGSTLLAGPQLLSRSPGTGKRQRTAKAGDAGPLANAHWPSPPKSRRAGGVSV